MEKNNYLNKLLEDTAKVVKVVSAQQKSFNEALPKLEKDLKEQGADMTIINEIKKAAASGDINAMLKAQEKFLKK
ncbi:MAG: hypothetical protein ACW99Q_14625 [Candidatus Kariarchaeaceae archaeon]|jgi:uncharacterized protein (DUF302 family)